MSFYAPFYHHPYAPYSRPRSYAPAYDPYRDLDDLRSGEDYYRRIAEEHERRAEAALALAREEERLRGLDFQRRATLPGLDQSGYHYHSDLDPHDVPPAYAFRPSPEQQLRDEHERRIDAWLARRAERDEASRRAETPDDRAIKQLLRAFGVAVPEDRGRSGGPTKRSEISHEHTCSCHTGQRRPSVPARSGSPASRRNELASRMWDALSGSRTNEEKADILRSLGLVPPASAAITSEMGGLDAGRPEPAPTGPAIQSIRVPIVVRSASPATTTPAKSEPSKATPSPSPTPTRPPIPSGAPTSTSTPSPGASLGSHPRTTSLARVEAIQLAFDGLRSAFASIFAPTTAQLTQYEFDLNKLLADLDGVESDGAEIIRGARKALVLAVEMELDSVEKRKAPAAKEPNPDVDMQVDEPSAMTASTQEAAPAEESHDEAVAEPPAASSAPVDVPPSEGSRAAADHAEGTMEIVPEVSKEDIPSVVPEPERIELLTRTDDQSAVDLSGDVEPPTPMPTKRRPSVEIEEVPDEEFLRASA